MLSSMFSSFDAFCAESSGRKFGRRSSCSSAPPATAADLNKKVESPVSETKASSVSGQGSDVKGNTTATNHVSSAAAGGGDMKPAAMEKSQLQKKLRFAVELDGLHCYETIISYY